MTNASKTVVSKDAAYTAGKWYACYCNCKKVAWKTTSGTCKYCGGKTKNKLVVYTDPRVTATYYDSSDKSYYFNKKLTVSQNGNVRLIHWNGSAVDSFETKSTKTSVYKGYKQDKIEMRGDRAEMSDFPLYLNTVAGGLDRRDQTIGGFSFVVKIYTVPVVEIIG